MCGLFGFSGKDKPNLEKIKILGLYNQKRGLDSCGIWYNDELKKGFDKNKLFSDFIQDDVFPQVKPAHNVLIGHTRWATTGAHTENNAHPFLIDNEHCKMVIAHNGTIGNIWTLCPEHGIDGSKIYVDSLALGMIINKDGFKVLNEYKGYAALLFQNLEEPDSLYVYHGASRTKPESDTEWEERPMYYMQTKEGFYFSSLEEALKAIKDDPKQNPMTLPHNVVYKFTKGILTKTKHEVKRGDINVEYPIKTFTPQRNVATRPPSYSAGRGTVLGRKNLRPVIWQETFPYNAKNKDISCIYYHKGRYWYSSDKLLCNGIVYVNKKGIVKAKGAHGANPFYFFKGVMLKSEKYLTHLQGLKPDANNLDITRENNQINSIHGNFALAISKYSVFPVTHLQTEGVNVGEEYRFMWWHDNTSAITTGYTPKFSARSYAIKDGVFEKVSSADPKELPLLHESSNLNVWDANTVWDNERCLWVPKDVVHLLPQETALGNLNDHLQANMFKDLQATLKKMDDANCCLVGASDDTTKVEEAEEAEVVAMWDGDGNPINMKDIKVSGKTQTELEAYKNKVNSYTDKYAIKTQYLAKIWHKIFQNVDDALDEMGSTNILALEYYLTDLYKHEFNTTLGNDEMRATLYDFVKQCVNDGVSLDENMAPYNADTQKWLSSPELYIELALDFEEDDTMINETIPEKNMIPFETLQEDPQQVEQEKKDAEMEFRRLYNVLKDVERQADEMQLLNTSDMAQEISYELYQMLDKIRKELANIAREHGLEELYSKYTKGEVI